MTQAAVALAALLGVAGCGGSTTPAPAAPTPEVPPRAVTAGDPVLAWLPAGAEIVIELDLARLRGNPVIGDLVTRYLGDPALATATDGLDPALGGGLLAGPLAHADAVVLASYRVGTAAAATVSVLIGDDLGGDDVPGGTVIGDGAIALAPPELVAELAATAAGSGETIAGDLPHLALRAGAMPARADGASLRITARLSFDARVSLASQLDVEAAPASLSLWGDVADDLAVVAEIDAPDVGGGAVGDATAAAMAEAVESWLAGLAAEAPIKALGLAPALRAAQIAHAGDRVSVVALVGPQRLARAAARLRLFLGPSSQRPHP